MAGLAALAALAANNNIVEEVAWMIGDQPIYKSEIEEAYQQMLYEKEPIKGDPYCVIPERLAIEKLFLHQADIDTVEVQESMVNQAVEQRINYLVTNLGSKEKLEEYFRKPMVEFREQMADAMRNQYRVQQVQSNISKDLKTTPSDVRKYFDKLPTDSIPFIPTQVEAEIITINPKIPQQEIDDVKARLRDYADRVNKGEASFSTLAIMYSEDGSAMQGGELGFRGKADFVPEFSAVAFNLSDPKRVSRIVETEYGFHIIQLIEKRGEQANFRHILLTPKVSDKDLADAVVKLDSLRKEIISGKFTFEEAAQYVSQDKNTKNNKGIMMNQSTGSARFEMQDLYPEVARKIELMQPGDISEAFIMKDPTKNRDVVAIVKLTQRIPGHKATLADDFNLIKQMYEASAKEKIVKDWIEQKIRNTYTKIADGWDGCQFQYDGWNSNN